MKQYQEIVQELLDYLLKRKMCFSSRMSHLRCYNNFGEYLLESERDFSQESSDLWLENVKVTHSSQEYFFWRQHIFQLHTFHKEGFIPDHLFYQIRSSYDKVAPGLKKQLDIYLDSCEGCYTSSSFHHLKTYSSRIMIFFSEKEITKIEDITFSIIDDLYSYNPYCNNKTHYNYLGYGRQMLSFFSDMNLCHKAFGMMLDEYIYDHVGKLEAFSSENRSRISMNCKNDGISPDSFWIIRESYLAGMESLSYRQTLLKQSAHVLKALYLFLYRYDLNYTPALSWIWFEEIRVKAGTCWKSWRRVIRSFEEYWETGKIEQKATRFIYRPHLLESLQKWCQEPVNGFGDQLQRSFREEITAEKYKYHCIRFCKFLESQGLQGFPELTLDHIRSFSQTDEHDTPVGRATTLTIVRQFLFYLEEKGLAAKGLHKGIITKRSGQSEITDILTEDQISSIYLYRSKAKTAIEFRNSAMVVLGLEMGLRACDVINLKLTDIDWKNRKISIIQQKTKAFLQLPMSNGTGNSLFRYLKYGRPETKSPYMFVHSKAPYGKLSTKVCCNAFYAILPERKEIYHKGFHVLRRTFATNVLRNGVGIDTVMDTLGHMDNTTVMKYLSFDEERMRMCPLSLESLSISWKEGIFNV